MVNRVLIILGFAVFFVACALAAWLAFLGTIRQPAPHEGIRAAQVFMRNDSLIVMTGTGAWYVPRTWCGAVPRQ